ncbi:MAG: hypothetical protein LBL04_14000 [Bacteroidales bacterium]|jgi:hypothetical protein|nr:hypothetical protein [Bacteroidales bacterium]
MIEIYQSIARAVAEADGIRHADIGKRIEDHTIAYPAAFVQDVNCTPEEIGDQKYFGEFTFSVVIFLKPCHDSRERPKPPRAVQDNLAAAFAGVHAVRRAVYGLNDQTVQNTVWLRESLGRDRDGMYVVTQFWKAVAAVDFAPVPAPGPDRPRLVMEEKTG